MSKRKVTLRDILEATRENTHLLRELLHRLPPIHRLSAFAAVEFSGEIMANNALTLTVGQTSTVSPYLADGTTGTTPSGATYSAATYTFSDPSATVTPNPDGLTAIVTGVAPSTGPVSGSVAFTATDTDGAVSEWTVTFTVTTNAVAPPPPPAQLSQSAGVVFTTPE